MLPSGVWVYFIWLPNEEVSIDSVFVVQSKWERKFPHWIEGSVKWYSTLVLTIWFVSACEYAGNGSRYEA
jgi:hypothetical protein